MITLYQFHPALGLPNASPFCMKLETYFKMAGVNYQNKYVDQPNKAPLGKLPYINMGGQDIPDSGLIIKTLKDQGIADLDAHLSAEQSAISFAVKRLVEEHLYWTLLYSRWLDDRYSDTIKDGFFAKVPRPMRGFIFKIVQRDLKRSAKGHGLCRHDEETIYAMGRDNLQAISDMLGDKHYFHGDKVSSIDATLYGHLGGIILADMKATPLKDAAMSMPNLVEYVQRLKGEFWAG